MSFFGDVSVSIGEAQVESGVITSADWNSTKYPGVCKPTNFAALAIFQEMQAQANRMAQYFGLAKVGVDGDLGPGTIKLVNALNAKGMKIPFPIATCSQIAAVALQLGAIFRGTADTFRVPSKVSGGTVWKPVTILPPAGGEVAAPAKYQANASPAFGGALGGASSILALGALGAIVYILHKDRKGGRKRGGTKARGRRSMVRRLRRRRR